MNVNYLNYHGNDLEDKFIVENYPLPDSGVFVDIGAGPDGIKGNNTYLFERNGWTGIVIDGDPRVYGDLCKNRKVALNEVISSNEKEVSYFMNEKTPDLSGLKNYHDNSDRSIKVTPVTLESVLEKHNIGKIDLISIDTEGTEMDVWSSFDLEKHRPRLAIIEFITQSNVNTGIIDTLSNQGYLFKARVGPNLIFNDRNYL